LPQVAAAVCSKPRVGTLIFGERRGEEAGSVPGQKVAGTALLSCRPKQPRRRLRVDHSSTRKKQRCWSTLLVVAALRIKFTGIADQQEG
jgi:hypothetical protein